MKKILIISLFATLISVSLSAKTISLSNADCVSFAGNIALQKKFGFMPQSMIRGQIRFGELVSVYSPERCTKAFKEKKQKASFSCEIKSEFEELSKENITLKKYTGSCL